MYSVAHPLVCYILLMIIGKFHWLVGDTVATYYPSSPSHFIKNP